MKQVLKGVVWDEVEDAKSAERCAKVVVEGRKTRSEDANGTTLDLYILAIREQMSGGVWASVEHFTNDEGQYPLRVSPNQSARRVLTLPMMR